jgi:hypothetical protein
MTLPTISARVSAGASALSPFPPSFDNSPVLYGMALASLMSIGIFALVTSLWMLRDIWRDRSIDHPLSLSFLFRLMIAAVYFTGFLRCLPEVVYNTCFGEVTGARMAMILYVKKMADIVSLPTAAFGMLILNLIYPHVMIELRSQRARGVVIVDPLSLWPRLARPALIFSLVILIASLMAFAKGEMGHG